MFCLPTPFSVLASKVKVIEMPISENIEDIHAHHDQKCSPLFLSKKIFEKVFFSPPPTVKMLIALSLPALIYIYFIAVSQSPTTPLTQQY